VATCSARNTEGDFYFVARGDEIIKSRGEKVSPAEAWPHRVPKQVLLVSELPRTENGKLSRKLILKRYAGLIADSA
jgi:acyl-coenzyme A synthetase/AMP-(fatty) acid ligase